MFLIVARQIVLEIDGDCEFRHVYPGLMAAIDAVEGSAKAQGAARFALNRNIMMPVSKEYLQIGYTYPDLKCDTHFSTSSFTAE